MKAISIYFYRTGNVETPENVLVTKDRLIIDYPDEIDGQGVSLRDREIRILGIELPVILSEVGPLVLIPGEVDEEAKIRADAFVRTSHFDVHTAVSPKKPNDHKVQNVINLVSGIREAEFHNAYLITDKARGPFAVFAKDGFADFQWEIAAAEHDLTAECTFSNGSVFVKTPTGEGVVLELSGESTIDDLKAKAKDLLRMRGAKK